MFKSTKYFYLKKLKIIMSKMDIKPSCNDYRVAMLSKLYLTVSGIIMPSLNLNIIRIFYELYGWNSYLAAD